MRYVALSDYCRSHFSLSLSFFCFGFETGRLSRGHYTDSTGEEMKPFSQRDVIFALSASCFLQFSEM